MAIYGPSFLIGIQSTEEFIVNESTSNTLSFVTRSGIANTTCTFYPKYTSNKEFGYWRSHLDLVDIFNLGFFPLEGTGISPDFNTIVTDIVSDNQFEASGNTSWYEAGQIESKYGRESIEERSLSFKEDSYLNLGPSIAPTGSFSIYTKIAPSGYNFNTKIIEKSNVIPYQFTVGIDSIGRYYARTTSEDSTHTIYSFDLIDNYSTPTTLLTVYNANDNLISLYVNGILSASSPVTAPKNDNTLSADVVIGVDGSPNNSSFNPFNGWISEIGFADYPITQEQASGIHDDTFGLGKFVRNDIDDYGGLDNSGDFNFDYNIDYDRRDTEYIELLIDSGNIVNAIGGAYSSDLWNIGTYQPSAILQLEMDDDLENYIYPTTSENKIVIKTLIDHHTNGTGNLRFAIKKRDTAPSDVQDFQWYSDLISIPSGIDQFITVSGSYFGDAQSISSRDWNNQILEVQAIYDDESEPYHARLDIYTINIILSCQTELQSEGGTNTLTLYTDGAIPTLLSNNLDLYVKADDFYEDLDFFVRSEGEEENDLTLFVFGSFPEIEQRNIVNFTTAGLDEYYDTVDLYVHSPPPSEVLPFYIGGPSSTGDLGIVRFLDFNVRGRGVTDKDYLENDTKFFLYQDGRYSSSLPMVVRSPSDQEFYSEIPFVVGSSPDTEAKSISFVVYNEYSDETNSVDFFVNAPDGYPVSGNLSLVTSGKGPVEDTNQFNMFVFNPENTEDTLTFYVSSTISETSDINMVVYNDSTDFNIDTIDFWVRGYQI